MTLQFHSKDYIYEAKHTVIVGKLIGVAQKMDGTKLAMLETSNNDIFVGDVHHIHDPDELRSV